MIGKIPENENSYKDMQHDIQKYDAIVIGPGLGKGDHVRKVVLDILTYFAGPVVVDADAINVLSLKEDCITRLENLQRQRTSLKLSDFFSSQKNKQSEYGGFDYLMAAVDSFLSFFERNFTENNSEFYAAIELWPYG